MLVTGGVERWWTTWRATPARPCPKISEDDVTTNKLLGGLITTSAWGVVLVALFSVFSLIVLLRKVRPGTYCSPRRRIISRSRNKGSHAYC